MFKQTVETSASPHVTVTECLGDLVVRGSEEQQLTVRLRNGADEAVLERNGETFTLVAGADCYITCPAGATLNVHTVRGGLKVKGVRGPVAIGSAYGSAALNDVGPLELEQVFGALSASGVEGGLEVRTAWGSMRIREVEGPLSLDRVGGNLRVEGLQGDLEVEQVGGNVRLGPPFSVGASFRLKVGGNLTLYLPAEASLQLSLQASGRVNSHLPDLVLEQRDGEAKGVLGEGEANLEAQVGGNITLRPAGPEEGVAAGLEFDFLMPDLEGLGEQIEARIAEAMTEMEVRLEESLGRLDSEAVLRQRVERAAERARMKMERAAERARLRAERAERRWQRASGHRTRVTQTEPVSDEERMRVLRMVEEGKITPEQAADLLAALEGH